VKKSYFCPPPEHSPFPKLSSSSNIGWHYYVSIRLFALENTYAALRALDTKERANNADHVKRSRGPAKSNTTDSESNDFSNKNNNNNNDLSLNRSQTQNLDASPINTLGETVEDNDDEVDDDAIRLKETAISRVYTLVTMDTIQNKKRGKGNWRLYKRLGLFGILPDP
jgi:hypothetical protein